MPEIAFYAIMNNDINKVLAVLLEKSLKIKKICGVQVNTQAEAEHINKFLWASVDWLPHCLVGATEEQDTPVVIKALTSSSFKQKINYSFQMGSLEHQDISNFEKVFIIFTLQDTDNMLYKQQQFKQYQAEKYLVSFYKQNEKGTFEKYI